MSWIAPDAFFGNCESSARIARVLGFGSAAIATLKNGSQKLRAASWPLGSIEKYRS